jgi:hypothetical protein
MIAQPRNLMDAWRAWDAYHRKIIREFAQDFTNKLALRRFRKRIGLNWKEIGKLHPDDHGDLKRRFLRHSEEFRRVHTAYRRASTRKHAHTAASRANHVNEHLGPHEDYLRALNRVLLELNSLIRFERRVIGEPADRIRNYDQRREVDYQYRFHENALRLALVRPRHEGIAPPGGVSPNREPSRAGYQQLGQPDRNVDHHPGGYMFYVHLSTNEQTTAACWVLTDGNNVIVDRVVAKDVWDIQSSNKWNSPLYWFGEPMDPITKQPQEALIQEKLVHESILRIRSWHLHAHKLMCRVSPCTDCPQSPLYADALWLTLSSFYSSTALTGMQWTLSTDTTSIGISAGETRQT